MTRVNTQLLVSPAFAAICRADFLACTRQDRHRVTAQLSTTGTTTRVLTMNTYGSRSHGPSATASIIRNTPMGGEAEARILTDEMGDQPASPRSQESGRSRCNAPIRMLRISQVLALTGIGKTTLYKLQATGDFPLRVKLTQTSVAWVEGEVQAWLAARIASNTPFRPR